MAKIEPVDIDDYKDKLQERDDVDLSELWRNLSQMLDAVKAEAFARGWMKDPDEIPPQLWGGRQE